MDKTRVALDKLTDVKLELCRLKSALDMMNKAYDVQQKKEWVYLSDKAKLHFIKHAPNWTTLDLIGAVEAELKERNT